MDLREQVERYLAGALSPGEEADLERLLRSDDGALREMLSASRREIALRQALKALEPAAAKPVRRRPDPGRGARPAWIVWSVAAAGLAILILGALLTGRPEPAPRSTARKETTAPKAPPAPTPAPLPERPAPEPPIQPPRLEPAPAPAPARPETAPAPIPAPPPPEPPVPPAPRKTAPPEPEKPVPKPPESKPLLERVAKLERVQGEVLRVEGEKKAPARPGEEVWTAQEIRTEARSGAAVRYDDGTLLELGPETKVLFANGGRRVSLSQGALLANVARQEKDRPFLFSTPHGEVLVLGTTLRIDIARTGARVELETGRVRVTRTDGASVEVAAGQFVMMSKGLLLAPKPALGPNLMAEPGFEQDGRRWTKIHNPQTGGLFGSRSVDAAQGRERVPSARFDANAQFDHDLYQDVPVKGGEVYQLHAWVRTDRLEGDGVALLLAWLGARVSGDINSIETAALEARGLVLGTEPAGSLNGTRDWTRISGRFAAPPRAQMARVRFVRAPEPDGAGAAWIDDVSLQKRN